MEDNRLQKTQFFVEANGFEKQKLWEEFHETISWEQDLSGFIIEIGKIKKRPICIEFSFAKIGEKQIAFYYGCSTLVDHKMIEDFLEENYPVKYDNGSRKAITDAMNFHNCYHFCLEK